MEAVVVIDMLEDFVTGALKCERADRIIPNIKKLVETSRKKTIPIIYSSDAHLPTDFELKKWGKHAMKGTRGAEVISQLKPAKEDIVLEKRAYSGFFETGLDSVLRNLKVDTLILTGLHTNMCVRHTAADAFFQRLQTSNSTRRYRGIYRKRLQRRLKLFEKRLQRRNHRDRQDN